MNELRGKLFDLVCKHISTLQAEAADISAEFGRSTPDVTRCFQAAHKIKGSSGSLGFKQVSLAALALETHLKLLSQKGRAPDRRAFALLGEFSSTLRNLSPENSTLISQ